MRAVVLALLGGYVITTTVLLGLYMNDQYIREPISVVTGASSGTFTVGFNITGVLTAIFAMKFVMDHMLNLISRRGHYNCRMFTAYVLMHLGIIIGVILSISSFGLHCYYTSCFHMETPLYVPVLIHVMIIFAWVGFSVIRFTIIILAWAACGENVNADILSICIKPPAERIPAADPTTPDIENANIPFGLVQNINKFGPETICTICHAEYEAKIKTTVLHCAHYYHTACIDTWLHDHPTCPKCKVDIPSE